MSEHSQTSHAYAALTVCVLAIGFLSALAACSSQDRLKRADGYFQEGLSSLQVDRQSAFVSFQKAVQENPSHKEALYYLGHVYALQQRYDEAERKFREVLRIAPDYSEAHTYLGQVLTQLGRWREAIESYRRALANPLYVTPDLARFHLGRALAHEGEMDEAIRAFEDALLVSPLSVPEEALRLELGRAYYRLGRDGEAREALVRVVKLDQNGEYAEAANQLLERLRP